MIRLSWHGECCYNRGVCNGCDAHLRIRQWI